MTFFNKVFAPFYAALKDSDIANHVDADAEKYALLCGKNRFFFEAITGSAPGNDSPMSQKNPQGLIGIDHSGPPFGQNIRHTVWSLGGIHTSTTYLNEKRAFQITDPNDFLVLRFCFYVKPYPQIEDTPNSKLFFALRLVNQNAAASTIKVEVVSGGTTTILSDQTAPAGPSNYTYISWGSASDSFPVFSGWNTGLIRIRATVATPSNPVEIIHASISSLSKFGH